MKKTLIIVFITILYLSNVLLVNGNTNIYECSKTIKNHILFNNDSKSDIYFNQDSQNVLINLKKTGISYGHELLWKVNTTGTNYEESAVAYIDGIAYIGSCSTHGKGHDSLFAVDTNNGEILWSKLTGPGYVGPVIDDDVIYIGTDSHGHDPSNEYMYAINRLNGDEIWNINIYGGIPESVQFDNDKIYFCSDTVYSLNKGDGSINWTYDMGSICVTKPLLKDNALYVASYGKKFCKLNASDGSRIWSTVLSAGPWDNSITTDGKGHLFLAIYYDKTINAYDEDDGSLIWSYELYGGPLSFNAYHNGILFISDTKGYVYALNSVNGTLIWENKIGNIIDISSPSLSGGLLFIGTRDYVEGAFFVLNESNGDILWKYHVGASVTAPPTIAEGMMLCGTDGWYMYAFDFGIGSGDWILHRYDSSNTAYSPDGLETWQYVEAKCSTKEDITTCTIINNYDHAVKNITLYLENNFNAKWYDSFGNLLKSTSSSYTIDTLSKSEELILIISNNIISPPNKPDKPVGITSGKIRENYSYSTITTDIDGDKVFYWFDWGDGDSSNSSWIGSFYSGQIIYTNHAWSKKGTFEIKVKAKDEHGLESEWSDPLIVTMPKFKGINTWYWLFENFIK